MTVTGFLSIGNLNPECFNAAKNFICGRVCSYPLTKHHLIIWIQQLYNPCVSLIPTLPLLSGSLFLVILCVCVVLCAYVAAYLQACVLVSIYTYLFAACVRACVCSRVRACVRSRVLACVRVFVCVNVFVCSPVCVRACVRGCVRVRVRVLSCWPVFISFECLCAYASACLHATYEYFRLVFRYLGDACNCPLPLTTTPVDIFSI